MSCSLLLLSLVVALNASYLSHRNVVLDVQKSIKTIIYEDVKLSDNHTKVKGSLRYNGEFLTFTVSRILPERSYLYIFTYEGTDVRNTVYDSRTKELFYSQIAFTNIENIMEFQLLQGSITEHFLPKHFSYIRAVYRKTLLTALLFPISNRARKYMHEHFSSKSFL